MNIPSHVAKAVAEALGLLPPQMTSDRAKVQLYATGLQESRFVHRRQIGGPARGYWQFELGTRESRGGVWGVYLHDKSKVLLANLCAKRGIPFSPPAIYAAIENDDVLAAGLARLMYWTVPTSLPELGDQQGAWNAYVKTWRPGKPHPGTWAECYATAMAAL